ncbi:TM0106 family RecB-like putative nuclease [Labedella endophytica]|uniref:TM0106 family RecB-like putative nuclease n=1 Tax=Labedella endophytica TaxID=1523160 RepID=A0A433JQ54_9MICO|nr:bifunctional RecB family nuclease/DEAD/DEAH box helicase [Labedella endophytica]RUQ98241.1 TM0106 family RecB-like putative nuclease [Labedella endophytica]
MYLLDGVTPITSASDLTAASKCEFAFLRSIDAKLGRVEATVDDDPMYARSSALGDEHELRVLEQYRAEFGDAVREFERPDVRDRAAMEQAHRETMQAFRDGAPLVFQAVFFDGSFVGFADFIVRVPATEDKPARYRVQDTKLARSAKVPALLQLAAYVEQLSNEGIPVDDEVDVILGDGTVSTHLVADILPVYRRRRNRLVRIVQERLDDTEPVRWDDPRYTIDGRCADCEREIQERRDVLLVARVRLTQRERLRAARVTTIDELAARTEPVEGIATATLEGLREQAELQLQAPSDGGAPPVRLISTDPIAHLPVPDPGDVFFDFEGDPLYTEGSPGHPVGTRWGLDYLFGLVDVDEKFTAWWAHDFAAEREALRGFLDWIAERRARFPGLHIYHYAAYERTHLLALAARHGTGEEEVDQLLREGVLVDLYPVVRAAVRVGSRSYSIKKLEPLYMGEEHRESDVKDGAASIEAYAHARELAASPDPAVRERGAAELAEIGDYNRYDCVSTVRLRDYLLSLARAVGVEPGAPVVEVGELAVAEPSPLHAELTRLAGDPLDPERDADHAALALAAAAIDYHRREQKVFWQEHFTRLSAPVDEWADVRDVFVVDSVEVVRDWYREGKQRTDRRVLRLHGTPAPGSSLKAGSELNALYDVPAPFSNPGGTPGARSWTGIRVLENDDEGTLLIEEGLRGGRDPYDDAPVALTPGAPPRAGAQATAIEHWGNAILDAFAATANVLHPGMDLASASWPADPVVDILRRRAPRTVSGSPLRHSLGDDGAARTVPDIVASLLDLDQSYVAVQGPPGTGKTYVATHVIADLVREHGWAVGVVAQSHAAVEHLLTGLVNNGLSPQLVAKSLSASSTSASVGPDEAERAFTVLPKSGHLAYAAERTAAGTGYVIGGTAWDFSNTDRFGRRQLDLLVVEEAGQFSLAPTIAASVAARNLLLLGDPQQLPQVTQGIHPEPIDTSALGFVADGADVLPAEIGYFLAQSWRMDPAVTAAISDLSYAGQLRSAPSTAHRHLDGLAPGVHVVPVAHEGNATHSSEEAAAVVDIVRGVLGLGWTDPGALHDGKPLDRHPLEQSDVIVVCPFNAHVAAVHEALDTAGLTGVRVGTVDKFQGQEAVIAILSLAASSPTEVPRGMSFLLMKNRLNVAVSRAKWAAYVVHSPALTDYLPHTPAALAELSAFLRLTDAAVAPAS